MSTTEGAAGRWPWMAVEVSRYVHLVYTVFVMIFMAHIITIFIFSCSRKKEEKKVIEIPQKCNRDTGSIQCRLPRIPNQSQQPRSPQQQESNDKIIIYSHEREKLVTPITTAKPGNELPADTTTQLSKDAAATVKTSLEKPEKKTESKKKPIKRVPKLKEPQAKPYILMENEAKNEDELYLEDQHIDKILGALVKTTGKRHRVGYITCLYSELVKKHNFDEPVLNTLQYIEPSAKEVSILCVPIYSTKHYTLGVFDLDKKMAWHFDTLMGSSRRGKAARLFAKIQAALERDLKMEFKQISKADCEKRINEQVDDYNCGVHICRIAEEIFFYGFSRRLSPFVIHDERQRIRDIYNGICDPEWNGEWFPQLQQSSSSNNNNNDDDITSPTRSPPRYDHSSNSYEISDQSDSHEESDDAQKSTKSPIVSSDNGDEEDERKPVRKSTRHSSNLKADQERSNYHSSSNSKVSRAADAIQNGVEKTDHKQSELRKSQSLVGLTKKNSRRSKRDGPVKTL